MARTIAPEKMGGPTRLLFESIYKRKSVIKAIKMLDPGTYTQQEALFKILPKKLNGVSLNTLLYQIMYPSTNAAQHKAIMEAAKPNKTEETIKALKAYDKIAKKYSKTKKQREKKAKKKTKKKKEA